MTDPRSSTEKAANVSARDQLRKEIFAARPVGSLTVDFFGGEIEIKQPSLRAILDAQSAADDKQGIASMLVRFCYVPGTNERVFEDTDMDTLLDMPFGPEMVAVQEAISKLTGVNLQQAKEELDKNPT